MSEKSEAEQHCIKRHRKIPRRAVLVFEDFNPLVAFGHAEEVAVDVGLALQRNKHSSTSDTFQPQNQTKIQKNMIWLTFYIFKHQTFDVRHSFWELFGYLQADTMLYIKYIYYWIYILKPHLIVIILKSFFTIHWLLTVVMAPLPLTQRLQLAWRRTV